MKRNAHLPFPHRGRCGLRFAIPGDHEPKNDASRMTLPVG